MENPLTGGDCSCIIIWCQSKPLDRKENAVENQHTANRASEEIDRKVELAWLQAFYGGMLTDKQREVLTLHCEEDMSLGEIAQEAGISRQGVHDLLTRAAHKLFDMERKLGVAARFSRMEEGLENCREALRLKRYDEAEQMLEQLIALDQEESNGL
ncbi:MAG: hypothetical protein E7333_03700 [Clostridiales bacterium]|nr:hypothetical protein [Clostridiales bacterium]